MSKHYRPLSAIMPRNERATVWPVVRKPRPSHFMAARFYVLDDWQVFVRAFSKRCKARKWSRA